MAAPSGTSWSNIIGSGNYQARLGIYISLSNTNTQTTVTAQIWYWARYAVSDSGNTFYMDWDSNADTSIGSKSIKTSNNEWSTSNQIAIGTYSKTFNRGTANQTGYFSSRFKDIEYGGGSGSYYVSFTIPELSKYTVSYNANGGTGAPSSQTKIYGKDLVLSSAVPTRKGYKFLGWGTSSTDTSVDYAPGSKYTKNESITLYAIWKKTENIAINQNGTWKKGMASIGGKKGTPYIKQNGVWKKGGA